VPLICVILFLFISALAAFIANMKGRSGWKLFLKMNGAALAVDVFMLLAFPDLEHRRLAVTLVILAGGVVVLGMTVFSPNSMQVAVRDGQYGEYKRCPQCAEPVRREAVKCKHCQSDLPEIKPI
jgi:hypothetical protein